MHPPELVPVAGSPALGGRGTVPSAPHAGVVLTHPEWGIYLGSCMGLGFWSKADPVGQNSACVFESEDQARRHVASWDPDPELSPPQRPDDFGYAPVSTVHPLYATLAEIEAAGLEPWNPNA